MCYLARMSDLNDRPAPTLENLDFMVGRWAGRRGEQRVEEAWSSPSAGCMSTMVRVNYPDGTLMIELISIRENAGTLILHLRQFGPELEVRLHQTMALVTLQQGLVRFQADPDAAIQTLTYRATDDQGMAVDVGLGGGVTVTAEFTRQP